MLRRASFLSWLFVTPALIIIAVLMYYPMVGTVIESFYSASFINPNPTFVGFGVYRQVFADGAFGQIVWNSIVWTVAVVALQNLLGFANSVRPDPRRPAMPNT